MREGRMEDTQILQILKALADQNRLAIIRHLGKGEACVCELLEVFSVTQPTLSHHMRILSEADLVVGRREGKWIHYSINEPTMKAFQANMQALECTHENLGGCACV